MKLIGWVGVLHVVVIVIWMMINIVFSILNPVILETGDSIAQVGLAYYSRFPGLLGFDHGSKALILLLSVLLPIGLFMYLRKVKDFQLLNLIALISGCLGFSFYSLSLMLQAVTVEYAFKLFRSSDDAFVHSFALYLYEWTMLEGGLSVSVYIIANLLLACWLLIHSFGLYKFISYRKLSVFGFSF